MKLDISVEFQDVQRSLNSMREDIGRRALATALNKTVELARTQMTREITREFNVTAGYVRERLAIKRATYRVAAFQMSAELAGGSNRGRSANLIRFADKFVSMAQIRRAAKEGKKPEMRFKIKRTGSKKVIPGAFVGNKGRTVFIRTGDKRLPIEALQTIDVAQMFNTKRINARVIATVRQRFGEVFAREARYFTQRFSQS